MADPGATERAEARREIERLRARLVSTEAYRDAARFAADELVIARDRAEADAAAAHEVIRQQNDAAVKQWQTIEQLTAEVERLGAQVERLSHEFEERTEALKRYEYLDELVEELTKAGLADSQRANKAEAEVRGLRKPTPSGGNTEVWSMCPVNPDNSPIPDPGATERANTESDGSVWPQQVTCSRCGKGVSSWVPKGTVVRAFVECLECIENTGATELDNVTDYGLAWRDRAERAEAEVQGLREALRDYGHHRSRCEQQGYYTCSCGYSDALAAVQPVEPLGGVQPEGEGSERGHRFKVSRTMRSTVGVVPDFYFPCAECGQGFRSHESLSLLDWPEPEGEGGR